MQLLCRKAHREKRVPRNVCPKLAQFVCFFSFSKFGNQMCNRLKCYFTRSVSVRKHEASRQVRSLRLRGVRYFVQGQKSSVGLNLSFLTLNHILFKKRILQNRVKKDSKELCCTTVGNSRFPRGRKPNEQAGAHHRAKGKEGPCALSVAEEDTKRVEPTQGNQRQIK